jgi:hypothetical protein
MKKNNIIFIVLIPIAVGSWYATREYIRKKPDLSNVSAKVSVDANNLLSSFEKDSAAANKTYLGNIITVSGTVKKIEKEDGATIVLASGGMSSVRCSMDTTHITELATIKEGQAVKIKGECAGYTADDMGLGADVILNRCVLEKN